MLYTQKASDRAIIDAVAAVAEARGGSRAQVALAWLRPNPVVVAPLLPATKPSHLDDAMAWLEMPPPILELILTPRTAAVFSMNPLGRREANATWPLHVLASSSWTAWRTR